MLQCCFELNNKPMSALGIGPISVPAFSGLGPHINRRTSACLPEVGPIPFGRYYIVNRQSGGQLGLLYDYLGGHRDWFSLYAADDRIDDETFCNEVRRGNFRLHPKGPSGISKGCIVVESRHDFDRIRAFLLSHGRRPIPGSQMLAYGMMLVK